ncbi:MAG: FAD-dependent oxidoreductase [Actinobacteria bacterium]|nr:MAG: FAD-dependent oxidoreductase [Actinomycetota bacterium]
MSEFSTIASSPGTRVEEYETVVIGGGQAGLATGYWLSRLGRPFLILDAGEEIGDSWRRRWDSMRLFTPARRDGLPGMRFPAPKHSFPSREEMGDYLEAYAQHFQLPVRCGVCVDALGRGTDGRFVIAAGERRFVADHVVIATGPFSAARVPDFSDQLDSQITQLHSSQYRNPAQLPDADVLVVGAGNSGADIALELARDRRVWLSGELGPHIPFNIEGLSGRLIFPLLWQVWSHVLTFGSPVGRRALPKIRAGKEPLIRVKPKDLAAAGVELVPRTIGVRDGQPLLDDERAMAVGGVVWCTGYRPQHDWIDLPVLDEDCELVTDHHGAVASEPGLYRVGREFLYAFNSHTVGGVGRDAKRIVEEIARSADLNPAGRRLLLERGAVQGRRRAAPLAS